MLKKQIYNFLHGILNDYDYYKISDLQIGGHCGLCGRWIPDEIFEKIWAWGMCKECKDKHS